ncbi:MAG: sulfatase, partial [Isosphaeraceae bacterium]
IHELKLDNTLVLFMADNGRTGAVINGKKLRGGKSSGFEGGLRVPLIARWPGVIPAGQTTTEFISSLEILPTLVAAADAKIPNGLHLDGFDMLDVLKGKSPSKRKEIFWDWPSAYQAARVDQFKWVSWTPRDQRGLVPAKEALFDLSTDPSESIDLIKTRPDVYQKVKNRFALWQAEMQKAEPRGPFRDY